ncbi:hypothetical protein Efla_000174 [Eimeria flavescens]
MECTDTAAAGNSSACTFEILPERVDFPQEEVHGFRFSQFTHHLRDVVCRYAHQTGHYVERRFGWDCHGLPIEFEIDKQLNICTRQQVLDFGIPQYNEQCRSIVLRYSAQWQAIVERAGRWIDFEDGYRTMDRDFMESVWWTFKQLFDKGRVYRAFKVMPFSTACGTPLSNFEANQNYKDVSDPSVLVAFKLYLDDDTANAFNSHRLDAAAATSSSRYNSNNSSSNTKKQQQQHQQQH